MIGFPPFLSGLKNFTSEPDRDTYFDTMSSNLSNNDRIKILEDKFDSLYLMNLAALELLTDLGVSKQQIMDKIEEIDLRDGKKDGKYTKSKNCPSCDRVINGRRPHCLYCGEKVAI